MQNNSLLELFSPGWVGSSIGLVGIAAAVITYLLTRQRSRLAYRYAGERLLGLASHGLPPDITVQYRGQPIPRLTRTLVVFWNAGEKTIPGEDVVASDPLRLKLCDDGSVLAATVLKKSREVCEVSVTLDSSSPDKVDLRFSFLDAGDGAVIEILHTSEARGAEVLGTIRGLPKGLDDLGRITAIGRTRYRLPLPLRGSPRKLGFLVSFVGALAVLAAVLVPWENIPKSPEPPTSWVVAAGGALYFLLGIALLLLTRRRYPKALHVEELE